MDAQQLIGVRVVIEANEAYEAESRAIIIAVNPAGTSVAVRMAERIGVGERRYAYAVAKNRYVGESLLPLLAGKGVICGITWIPDERFVISNPLDVSWWRGGNNVAVAEIRPA